MRVKVNRAVLQFKMACSPKTARAKVRNFSEKAGECDGARATCLLCKKKIVSKGGCTSSMRKHLEHCHQLEWTRVQEVAGKGQQSKPADSVKVRVGVMDQFIKPKICLA